MSRRPLPPDRDPLEGVDLEALRDAVVDAVNARDADWLAELLSADAELAGDGAEGPEAVAEAFMAWWTRAPDLLLTAALFDDEPAAVGWRRAEDAWVRTGVMRFECSEGDERLLGRIAYLDDPGSVEAALADEPDADEVAEELDWSFVTEGEDPADHVGETGPPH